LLPERFHQTGLMLRSQQSRTSERDPLQWNSPVAASAGEDVEKTPVKPAATPPATRSEVRTRRLDMYSSCGWMIAGIDGPHIAVIGLILC
jgi:hypothetical protein